MDKRRMCPNCRAFITTSDRTCPYCEATVGPRAIDVRSPGDILGGLIPHARFTTTMILLVNFALFLATLLYDMQGERGGSLFTIEGMTLFLFGGKYPEAIVRGQYWRLVTAGFLHGGVLHILMNMWALMDLGAQVEEMYGSARLLVFYFVASVAGFIASSFWSPALSIGASAAVFGLIGAMIALGVRHNTAMGSAIRGHYIRWAIYGFLFGLLPGLQVDNAAHLGGLAAGFGIAYVAGEPRMPGSKTEKVWQAAAGICLAATLYSFARMVLFLSSRP
ncbi:MAG: rhomboid family intramembrane serine protease [Candidatus Solibacter usitatus]|nr:rhomboid family intramembrane serine protease [Candidatus Solibacter usitatus]